LILVSVAIQFTPGFAAVVGKCLFKAAGIGTELQYDEA
jgi:hypothetical protein